MLNFWAEVSTKQPKKRSSLAYRTYFHQPLYDSPGGPPDLTNLTQELTVSMEPVPGFMFCGRQLVSTRLLPNSSQQLDFTLLPLRAGYLELPRFSVRSGDRSLGDPLLDPTAAADLARTSAKDRMLRQLRSHIFVLPLHQVTLTDN
ncbi:unnamed protein product [Schistocephalus solidus]|uniref:Gryzun-like domain-containing protein n=1 Tax=Schistocephalus solidus TaxID=70667 RepID=A0A183SE19_SCHSO|nr:unnamed protein product [Schistocephalus solidus]